MPVLLELRWQRWRVRQPGHLGYGNNSVNSGPRCCQSNYGTFRLIAFSGGLVSGSTPVISAIDRRQSDRSRMGTPRSAMQPGIQYGLGGRILGDGAVRAGDLFVRRRPTAPA